MAASVVYTTFNGMIVHENRGGTERDYMPDPLGSTAALLDNAQAKTDTWEYWPYGEVISRTGTNTTAFTFVGILGYFRELLDKLLYVRARYFAPNYGRWSTIDALWPLVPPYEYSRLQPTSMQDPSGHFGGTWELVKQCGLGILSGIGSLIDALKNGTPINLGSLLCSVGPPCIGAVVAFLLAGSLGELPPPISLCIAGIIGGLVNALLSIAFCSTPDPCNTKNSILCNALSLVNNSLSGCLGQVLGGAGLQLVDVIMQNILNLFNSEEVSLCMGQSIPIGGTAPAGKPLLPN